jgi:protein-S-isoprenylcysteine O-methyltransferase Ste14
MKEWKKYFLTYVWAILFTAEIVLVFIFGMVGKNRIESIIYIGVAIWWVAVVLAWLPIFILKRKGQVSKGKSFVHTTAVVDSGLYSIIRHPQYTSGLLFSFALILISQTWCITGMSLVTMLLMYKDILLADSHEVEKFGEAYRQYMKKVPRTNLILGIIRLLQRRQNMRASRK